MKALGSRNANTVHLHKKRQAFFTCIADLLELDDVKLLHQYQQHLQTTRFQHSLNVSYYSYLIANKLNLDACSIARAGLLHDLFLYDWKNKEQPIEGRHSYVHPRVALENAKKHIEVNSIIEDAIIHHMWPMTIAMPKTKEGWILQAVDKYCALLEMGFQIYNRILPSFLAF